MQASAVHSSVKRQVLKTILFALPTAMNLTASRVPAFRARLKQRDLVAWIGLQDGSIGRIVEIKGGKFYAHHVVNLVKAPEHRVHHIAFELRDTACHGVASDALRANGVNLLWGPSRHTAGHNIASYHHDPDKVMIEFYTEMDAFIPELGLSEPRPWHEHFPMKPRSWAQLNAWGADFAYNLAAG